MSERFARQSVRELAGGYRLIIRARARAVTCELLDRDGIPMRRMRTIRTEHPAQASAVYAQLMELHPDTVALLCHGWIPVTSTP